MAGLVLHGYVALQAMLLTFISNSYEFFIIILSLPQLLLFLKGIRLKSSYVFSQNKDTKLLDDIYEFKKTKPENYISNVESKYFSPLRFWSSLFAIIFIIFGPLLIKYYLEKYGVEFHSYLILSKTIRNWCMTFGGICTITYVISIKFYKV